MLNTGRQGGPASGTFLVVAFLLALLLPFSSHAEKTACGSNAGSPGLTIYLFWGEGCPHCGQEKVFLQTLVRKYPGLTVREFEVWHNRQNSALYERVMKSVPKTAAGVPATAVGKKLFIGFNSETAKGIEQTVVRCLKQGCPDALEALAGPREETGPGKEGTLSLPFLGEVDPATISLPLFTVVIGALDSFNPCAFFVLLFLLGMLIHARSRKKMFVIGALFVFFSGFMYFLFMAAWLNLFLIMGRLSMITLAAGAVALVIASINIKDFFFFKKGVSLVIPEQAKTKLFGRMRNLLKSSSTAAMVFGTIVLAVSANAYELLCTAGFPMIYTRALTLHDLDPLQYYFYLALYNVVYVIPLIVIVFIMSATLGTRKMTEWQGRQLKLVSGLMMFFLGLTLLVNPALLNNVLVSAGLLAAVLVLSAVTIYAAKRLKPHLAE